MIIFYWGAYGKRFTVKLLYNFEVLKGKFHLQNFDTIWLFHTTINSPYKFYQLSHQKYYIIIHLIIAFTYISICHMVYYTLITLLLLYFNAIFYSILISINVSYYFLITKCKTVFLFIFISSVFVFEAAVFVKYVGYYLPMRVLN